MSLKSTDIFVNKKKIKGEGQKHLKCTHTVWMKSSPKGQVFALFMWQVLHDAHEAVKAD